MMQLLQQFLVWPGIGWLLLNLDFHAQSRAELDIWIILSYTKFEFRTWSTWRYCRIHVEETG